MQGKLAILIGLAALWTACGQGPMILASTPTPGEGAAVLEVTSPTGAVKVESLELEWTPVMIGDDGGAMLAEALADRAAVMVMLPDAADAALEERVYRMIQATAPGTKVVARARATLDALMMEQGEIPYRVTLEPGGTDAFGRPYYLPKEHPLRTDWLTRKKAMRGADAMLVVGPVRVGEARMRELRERRRGSCEALDGALARSIEGAAEVLAPFVAEADDRLERSFARHLAKALPFWREEVESVLAKTEPKGTNARCLVAYRRYLDEYAGCVDRACEVAPRVFSREGVVGMDDDPRLAIPAGCPGPGDRDLAGEMTALAARSVEDVLGALGAAWAGEQLRMNALVRLRDGLRDECAPRHRRFDRADLKAARDDVAATARAIEEAPVLASWVGAGGRARVSGTGPVTVLARAKATSGDLESAVAASLERLRALDRCDTGEERLMRATLIDVGSSEVVFMGVFFEEQLLCEDLASGVP